MDGTTVNAPLYMYIPNKRLDIDLKIPTVSEEITKFSIKFVDNLTTHPNKLGSTLVEEEPRRLTRLKPTDVTTRFS
jgi:hypothetical protein